MPKFQLLTPPSFLEKLAAKPVDRQVAIIKTITLLSQGDFSRGGLRTKKIQGEKDMWEARIDQANRLSWRYSKQQGVIELLNHCNHDSIF